MGRSPDLLIARAAMAFGVRAREVLTAKHHQALRMQALRMKVRLVSFGFSLLLQPQNMFA